MASKDISILDSQSADKIRSLQVIISIESVVKELIENSLDSHSKNIDIRFHEYGIEKIEISDDGNGIKSTDIQKIGLRSYTSKMRDETDLSKIDTYGYRGEALSSLIHVSKLSIISRHDSSNLATKITFEKGKQISCSEVARDVGTTVIVTLLFNDIPVRRNELLKNIRSQYSRAEYIIESYGLISTNSQ
ncbi:hypothetical protein HZS_4151 [Henneguya salminicola]|nr:hypothetical protein HZS_4151 [Henneguya salminicola]